ncbi:MAG TPA: DNA-processing protein DprA [Vicinamibacterales bacterium]
MTLDQAVALSLAPTLHRPGLTARLRADDPELLAQTAPLLASAYDLRIRASRRGIDALAWNDLRFPTALLAIPDMPPVLWYRGLLDTLDAPAVAIVGSRAASAVALETAARLGAALAARGIVVVSGLARGVDSAAHRGALTTGRTIAVLGSGLERVYPAEHKGLADDIAHSGLVLSEHAPDAAPLPFHFPLRNRLISGLSRAVVVIEASDRSGSLITAACALEQGRDVMAVPGNVLSGRNRGGHALIRDGATIVECAEDVVNELGLATGSPGLSAPEASRNKSRTCTDPLLRGMDAGTVYDLDGLAGLSGLETSRLLPRLLDLELRGLVRRLDGGRFVRPL